MKAIVLDLQPANVIQGRSEKVRIHLQSGAFEGRGALGSRLVHLKFSCQTSDRRQIVRKIEAHEISDSTHPDPRRATFEFESSLFPNAGWWGIQVAINLEEDYSGEGRIFVQRSDVICAWTFGAELEHYGHDGVIYKRTPENFFPSSTGRYSCPFIPQMIQGTQDGIIYTSGQASSGDESAGFYPLEFNLEVGQSGPVVVVLKFAECRTLESGIRVFFPKIGGTSIHGMNKIDIHQSVGLFSAFDIPVIALPRSNLITVRLDAENITYSKTSASPIICAVAVFSCITPEWNGKPTYIGRNIENHINDLHVPADLEQRYSVGHKGTEKVPSLMSICADAISSHVNSYDGIPFDVRDLLNHQSDQSGKVLHGARGLLLKYPSLLPQSEDVYENLLLNGSAESGSLDGWNITQNGGDGWAICDGFSTAEKAFVTSYSECARNQIIDLISLGYSEEDLDKSPKVYVSETVIVGSCGGGGRYRLNVELRDRNNFRLVSNGVFSRYIDLGSDMQLVEHTFENYGKGLRYIFFQDSAVDGKYWKGHYGPKLTLAKVFVQIKKNQDIGHQKTIAIPSVIEQSISSIITDPIPTIEQSSEYSHTTSGILQMVFEADDELRFHLMASWLTESQGFVDAVWLYSNAISVVGSRDVHEQINLEYYCGCFFNDIGYYDSAAQILKNALDQLVELNSELSQSTEMKNQLQYEYTQQSTKIQLEYAKSLFLSDKIDVAFEVYKSILSQLTFKGAPSYLHQQIAAMNGYALCCLKTEFPFSSPKTAGVLLRNALEESRISLQRGHIDVSTLHHNISHLYYSSGSLKASELHLIQSLSCLCAASTDQTIQLQRLFQSASTLNNLAMLLKGRGQYDGALRFLANARVVYEKLVGSAHPFTLTVRHNEIVVLSKAENKEAADASTESLRYDLQRVVADYGRLDKTPGHLSEIQKIV